MATVSRFSSARITVPPLRWSRSTSVPPGRQARLAVLAISPAVLRRIFGRYKKSCRASSSSTPSSRTPIRSFSARCKRPAARPTSARSASRWAKEAGFTPDRMIHTHPCKTATDLAACHAEGVRWFTFDSPYELPKLVARSPDAELLLRLAGPPVRRASSTCRRSSAPRRHDAADLIRSRRHAEGLSVAGCRSTSARNAPRPEDFVPALAAAREVWDEAERAGCPLEVLDIGGGFPAPYRGARADARSVLPVPRRRRSTTSSATCRCGSSPSRAVGCAPTRSTLVTAVVGKSIRNGTPWYIIDDGIYGSFSGKAFDHADFPLLVEERASSAGDAVRGGRPDLRFGRRGLARSTAAGTGSRRTGAGAHDGRLQLGQRHRFQRPGSGTFDRYRVTITAQYFRTSA